MCCGRFLFFLLNFLVFGIGVAIVTLASMVIHTSGQYGDLMKKGIFTLPIWTIVVGLIISMVGFFGCFGALRKSKCLLYLYSAIVFALFVGQLALGILVLMDRDSIQEDVKVALKNGFEKYGGVDESFTKCIDLMETDMKCCGVDNYTEWYTTLAPNQVTKGCCLPDVGIDKCPKNLPDDKNEIKKLIYTDGCYTKFIDWINEMSLGLGITAIFMALVQLGCMFYSCSLAKSS